VLDARDPALGADCLVAERLVVSDGGDGVVERLAVGVSVDHHAFPRRAAQKLIDRHVQGLPGDVPERRIHRPDRGHRHRTTAPVRALVEVLPGVLDPARVAADEEGDDVLAEVRGDGQLAPVEGCVAKPGEPLVGLDLQRHEIAPRAAHDDPGVGDLHGTAPPVGE
jgi:hypothetical protein